MSIISKIVVCWNKKYSEDDDNVDHSDFSIIDANLMNNEGDHDHHNSMDGYNHLMPCFEDDGDDEDPIYDYAPAA
uniref:Uncharacterized protein n=1 Tax=Cucumis melo TaxID=3656 RepID=A0A9I9CJH7_CUCME